MGLKILISAATERELSSVEMIRVNGVDAEFLVTGVGGVSTTWNLMNYVAGHHRPDIMVNTGIAGSFSPAYPVGSVVIAGSDCFGDMGIEKDDRFITLFEAGFEKAYELPFINGLVHADTSLLHTAGESLPVVKGVTVNTSSGTLTAIGRLTGKFDPDIETMEGAAFYYTCTRLGIPAIAIRSISNMVLADDRSGWNIKLALEMLAPAVSDLIQKISGR